MSSSSEAEAPCPPVCEPTALRLGRNAFPASGGRPCHHLLRLPESQGHSPRQGRTAGVAVVRSCPCPRQHLPACDFSVLTLHVRTGRLQGRHSATGAGRTHASPRLRPVRKHRTGTRCDKVAPNAKMTVYASRTCAETSRGPGSRVKSRNRMDGSFTRDTLPRWSQGQRADTAQSQVFSASLST